MRLFIAVIFLSFNLTLAHAFWDDVSPDEFHVPKPPKSGSAAEDKDFEILHEYQETRTDADCDFAAYQETPTMKSYFGGKHAILTKEELADGEVLYARLLLLGHRISKYFKKVYDRPRPFLVDESLEPCIDKPSSDAYPSGHATTGYLTACILKEVFPDRAEEILERGMLIGELRVISGVHHPSDVDAGQDLAQQICDYLLSDEEFLEDLGL